MICMFSCNVFNTSNEGLHVCMFISIVCNAIPHVSLYRTGTRSMYMFISEMINASRMASTPWRSSWPRRLSLVSFFDNYFNHIGIILVASSGPSCGQVLAWAPFWSVWAILFVQLGCTFRYTSGIDSMWQYSPNFMGPHEARLDSMVPYGSICCHADIHT